MALLDPHSQTSHLVKPQERAEILDPALREQGLYCILTDNLLTQDESQFKTWLML